MELEPRAQGATTSNNQLHSTKSAGEYLIGAYACGMAFYWATFQIISMPTEQVQKPSDGVIRGLNDHDLLIIIACMMDVMHWKWILELFRQPRWEQRYLGPVVVITAPTVMLLASLIERDFIKIFQRFHLVVDGFASICFVIDTCTLYLTSKWPSLTFQREPKMD